MKQWLGAAILLGTLGSSVSGAEKGPEIMFIDSKLSVSADAISLGRLLRLLDQATGMQSKVPADLANRDISVRFSGLSFDDAVKKVFQGQPFDYVFIPGQGIIVTSLTQAVAGSDSPPPVANSASPPPFQQQTDEPFVQEQPAFGVQPGQTGLPGNPGVPPFVGIAPNNPFNQQPLNQQQQQQPSVIQTPFGPIANPRLNQAVQPNGIGTPVLGQQNPFGVQPSGTTTNPFGTPNPSGQNDLFGAPAPVFQTPNSPGTSNPANTVRRP